MHLNCWAFQIYIYIFLYLVAGTFSCQINVTPLIHFFVVPTLNLYIFLTWKLSLYKLLWRNAINWLLYLANADKNAKVNFKMFICVLKQPIWEWKVFLTPLLIKTFTSAFYYFVCVSTHSTHIHTKTQKQTNTNRHLQSTEEHRRVISIIESSSIV